MNTKSFASMGGDNDYHIFERYLIGRLTKARYKALTRWVRRHTWSTHCGCEYDCCGCQCSQSASIFVDRRNGWTVINLTKFYNY